MKTLDCFSCILHSPPVIPAPKFTNLGEFPDFMLFHSVVLLARIYFNTLNKRKTPVLGSASSMINIPSRLSAYGIFIC